MLVCGGVKPCLKLPRRDMLHANDRASGLWILTSWAQPNLHGASSSHPGDIAAANRIDVRHIGNISMFHVYVKCMTYIKIIENGCVTSNIHYIMTNMCLACSIGRIPVCHWNHNFLPSSSMLPGAGRTKRRVAGEPMQALRLERVSLVPSVSSPAKHLHFDVGKCWQKKT